MVEITQYALKGQKLLAQGSALGRYGRKVVALTGRIGDCYYTQGAALGCEFLPFQGVLLGSFCPLPFPSAGDRWFWACCWRASGSSGRANRTGRNIL